MKPYNKNNIAFAKELRKNMTRWERKLWYDFLCNYPIRFQRQKAIGNYIVDFYCAKARLAIEIDGKVHLIAEQGAKDVFRTQKLEEMNITVLRVSNIEVEKNFNLICERIDIMVKRLTGEF